MSAAFSQKPDTDPVCAAIPTGYGEINQVGCEVRAPCMRHGALMISAAAGFTLLVCCKSNKL